MNIAFHTLGCKVNQYESDAMKNKSKEKGWTVVDENSFSDIYVINTCTVTNLADRKSRQYIRRMKKINPDSVVVVTGCYAQVSEQEVKEIEGVNLVIGNNNKSKVIDIIDEYVRDSREDILSHVIPTSELIEFDEWHIDASFESKTRAFVKIQEGCNRYCSYCIIPYARGNIRSRSEENILEECRELISKGFKEIVLTGINTALYDDLDGLLDKLDNMEGEFRVRLSSLEPTVINKEYVEKILKRKRLCHHLHLSLQAGSDEVLKAMNRRYDSKEYVSIVDKIREFDEFYGITTDIIVGFPGESEKNFEDTLKVVEKVGFCRVHPFKYSARRGTKAAEMNNQVAESIKKNRSEELISLSNKVAVAFAQKNIGREEVVLFEEYDNKVNAVTGYTDNYIKAYYSCAEDDSEKYIGKLIDVKIDGIIHDGVKVIL